MKEEILEVDLSQIDKYVSPRELERYETAETRAEAEAEAAVRRAEAEELKARRLEKNARAPGAGRGRGGRALNGLGLGDDVGALGTRGRRGRPRDSRGRGNWRGRGASAIATQTTAEPELDTMDVDSTKQVFEDAEEDPDNAMLPIPHTIPETDDESSVDNNIKLPTPELARTSFVANSALPISPIASRRISQPVEVFRPESDNEASPGRRSRSMSSAAAQLHSERYRRPLPESEVESEGSDRDRDRHRAKRQRTRSTVSVRPKMAPPAKKFTVPIHPFFQKKCATKIPPFISDSVSESESESDSDSDSETSLEDPIAVFVPPRSATKPTRGGSSRSRHPIHEPRARHREGTISVRRQSTHDSRAGTRESSISVHRSNTKQSHRATSHKSADRFTQREISWPRHSIHTPGKERMKGTPSGYPTSRKYPHVPSAYRHDNDDDEDDDEDEDEDEDDDEEDDEEDDDDAEEYVVEAILKHDFNGGMNYYLVKWQGYENSDWLPEEDLEGAKELVTEYHQKLARRMGKQPVR